MWLISLYSILMTLISRICSVVVSCLPAGVHPWLSRIGLHFVGVSLRNSDRSLKLWRLSRSMDWNGYSSCFGRSVKSSSVGGFWRKQLPLSGENIGATPNIEELWERMDFLWRVSLFWRGLLHKQLRKSQLYHSGRKSCLLLSLFKSLSSWSILEPIIRHWRS